MLTARTQASLASITCGTINITLGKLRALPVDGGRRTVPRGAGGHAVVWRSHCQRLPYACSRHPTASPAAVFAPFSGSGTEQLMALLFGLGSKRGRSKPCDTSAGAVATKSSRDTARSGKATRARAGSDGADDVHYLHKSKIRQLAAQRRPRLHFARRKST